VVGISQFLNLVRRDVEMNKKLKFKNALFFLQISLIFIFEREISFGSDKPTPPDSSFGSSLAVGERSIDEAQMAQIRQHLRGIYPRAAHMSDRELDQHIHLVLGTMTPAQLLKIKNDDRTPDHESYLLWQQIFQKFHERSSERRIPLDLDWYDKHQGEARDDRAE
jgi:hypothetical protein